MGAARRLPFGGSIAPVMWLTAKRTRWRLEQSLIDGDVRTHGFEPMGSGVDLD
jgi:hypothetical protein